MSVSRAQVTEVPVIGLKNGRSEGSRPHNLSALGLHIFFRLN